MNKTLTRQEREKLNNRIVFLSSITVLYAILLAFIQKMMSSTLTVNGAFAFLQILRWGALGGSMLCAAWSAYKEKKEFFTYCGICIYVFFSTTIILFCVKNGTNKPFYINYVSLAVVFVLIQVYSYLKSRDLFKKKSVKLTFISVCALFAVIVAVVSIMQRMGI